MEQENNYSRINRRQKLQHKAIRVAFSGAIHEIWKERL